MKTLKTFEEFFWKKDLTPDEEYQKQKKEHEGSPSAKITNHRSKNDEDPFSGDEWKDLDSTLIKNKTKNKVQDKDPYGEEDWGELDERLFK